MSKDPKILPKTVEEAVDQILSSMSESDKELVKNTHEEGLDSFHVGWGMGIRNGFGLWGSNKELLKACGSEDMDPDEASMVIIKAVWENLQKK